MTNEQSSPNSRADWIDPDDAPPLTQQWFDGADAYVGERVVRRGRPPSENPKKLVSLRLDGAVLDWFRNSGAGWQSRINEALRKAAGL